jgi:glutamate-1-semialdehyde 2,1-aminomutase
VGDANIGEIGFWCYMLSRSTGALGGKTFSPVVLALSRRGTMVSIDRSRIKELLAREQERFVRDHPKSKALFERARASLLGGVPMNWMISWAGPYPIFAAEGHGAYVTDVDGHRYVDFCLGDTGAMFGHSPEVVAEVIAARASRGITMMLPTEDSIWVGEELARRFGLPYWQVALSATDANRFALRLARTATGRRKVLIFNAAYHGSVDETLVELREGRVGPKAFTIGEPVDPSITTKVVEFNDVEALEAALGQGDVAAVLAEPAMTNCGIVLPDLGYHEALREATERSGTLLILDETHTLSEGPGGYTAAHGLRPDMVTLGKPIGSGIPAAAYGISEGVAQRIQGRLEAEGADETGVGGTLSGNALAAAAMRATLERVITKEAYEHMIPLAARFAAGVDGVIRREGLPWHVVRLGARVEYAFTPKAPRHGGEAEAARDRLLERYMHLYALNRGVLLTPFHNMALVCPSTTAADVDLHTEVFGEAVAELIH